MTCAFFPIMSSHAYVHCTVVGPVHLYTGINGPPALFCMCEYFGMAAAPATANLQKIKRQWGGIFSPVGTVVAYSHRGGGGEGGALKALVSVPTMGAACTLYSIVLSSWLETFFNPQSAWRGLDILEPEVYTKSSHPFEPLPLFMKPESQGLQNQSHFRIYFGMSIRSPGGFV